MNHTVSRLTGGWLTPEYKVVYSASPKTDNPQLQTVFDAPEGAKDRLSGPKKRLSNQVDRMGFVGKIARDFNWLMDKERTCMNMRSTNSNKTRLGHCEPPRQLTPSEIDWLRQDARISLVRLQELQAQSKPRPT